MLRRCSLISLCCLLWLTSQQLSASGGDELIKRLEPTGSITDKANLLTHLQEQKLRGILHNLSAQTGAALVIVTLPSMEGGQIDDFTNRLFEKWGIGQADKDDGVLLLVAVKERKIRIEVGYGLESVISDGLAGSIRDKYILPYFKNGQMASGIESGTLALANLIAQHYKIEISEKPIVPSRKQQNDNWLVFIIVFAVVILQIVVRKNRHYSNRRRYYSSGGGWYIGGSSGNGSFGGGSSFGGFGGGMSGGGGASGGW